MRYGKVMITGGLGFIGRHVADLLVQTGWQVLLLDNLNPQTHGAVPNTAEYPLLRHSRVEVCRGDIRQSSDWEKVLPEARYIVHLAAETGTGQSMYEISRYTETNVCGTAGMLDYLANHRHQVKKIILGSSRAVYGEGAYYCRQCGLVYPEMRTEEMLSSGRWECQCPNCDASLEPAATPEDANLAPASIYAVTKRSQEDLVQVATRALGIPGVILRMQNVYGEGQSLKNPYTGILSIFSNQLRLGRALSLYEDGQESRDFVHVSDAARAVALALDSDAADGCTLNVGSGCATTIEQIAFLLHEYLGGKEPPTVSGEYRVGDVRHALADLTEVRSLLGFEPVVLLEEGLCRFIEWVKKQPIEPDRLARATQELVQRGLMLGRTTSESRSAASD